MTKRINDYILFCFCGCIFVLGIVIALFFSEEYTPIRINAHPIPHWSNVLSTILFSNIIVGISLSVFGILTCGLSTCTVLLWNGFLMGRSLNVPDDMLWEIGRHFIGHGIFELAAFFLFGTIGLKSMIMIIDYIRNQAFIVNKHLIIKQFITAFILLIIASIIETVSILSI